MFDFGPNITSIFLALITSIAAIIAAYFARNANTKADATLAKTTETHNLVNGRMDELLALTRTASKAEGISAGVAAATVATPSVP